MWLSAISRSRNVEEFVCEGWTPRPFELKSTDSHTQLIDKGDIHIVNLIEPNKPTSIKYTAESHELYAMNPVVKNGPPFQYPVTFVVDELQSNNDETSTNEIKKCFEFLIGARDFNESAFQLMAVKKICDKGYVFYAITCSYRSNIAYFIAVYGISSYVFNKKNQHYLTFYPADFCKKFCQGDSDTLENPDLLKNDVFPDLDMRYWRYNKKPFISPEKDSAVWKVFTSVRDAEHFDYLICAFLENETISYYWTVLPKKQYLKPEDFDKRVLEITKFIEPVEIPHPTMLRTVTHLETFSAIEFNLNKMGVFIDKSSEYSPYFHKCYGFLPDNEDELEKLIKKKENQGALHKCKGDYDVSIEKDEVFHKLSLESQLNCLGWMAAHDVLFFAVKN